MDATLLERLLYEDESSTLDFKRDQYKFSGGSDDDRSELLKDILGFANGWRRSDGYILIGVDDVRGGRSIVVGTTEQLVDHTLQQFVNCKLNRPLRFAYEVCPVDGKQIGVIRIEQQPRPFYLKKNYGKLEKDKVYVRRGSSTDPTKPATPEEIAQMGMAAHAPATQAELSIEFADPEREEALGTQIDWTAEFCRMPKAEEIPILDDRPSAIRLPGGQTIQMPSVSSLGILDRLNPNFYHQFAEFEFVRRLVRPVRLVVANTGEVPASDVRLEVCVPSGSGFGILDDSEIPEAPKRRNSFLASSALKNLKFRHPLKNAGDVDIEKNDHRTKVEIECGNLQPGRRVWTELFLLGIGQSGEIKLTGHLFAANLTQPQEFSLTVSADIINTSMTVDELIDLAEADNQRDDTDDED